MPQFLRQRESRVLWQHGYQPENIFLMILNVTTINLLTYGFSVQHFRVCLCFETNESFRTCHMDVIDIPAMF